MSNSKKVLPITKKSTKKIGKADTANTSSLANKQAKAAIEQENWRKAFEEWKSNATEHQIMYAHSKFRANFNLKQNYILGEVFIYIPKKREGETLLHYDLGLTLTQAANVKIFPFVKIIDAPIKSLIDKVFLVPDNMANLEINEDYVQWSNQVAEQPSYADEHDMPVKWRTGFVSWMNYIYDMDRFRLDSDRSVKDNHIFLMPVSFLNGHHLDTELTEEEVKFLVELPSQPYFRR